MPEFVAFTALCLYDFEAQDPAEMSFQRGELVRIIDSGVTGWGCAESHGKTGWVPAGYVQRDSDNLANMLQLVREEVNAEELEIETMAEIEGDEAPLLQEKSKRYTMKTKRLTQYQRALPRYHHNPVLAPKRPYAPEAGTLESLVTRLTAMPLSKSLYSEINHIKQLIPSQNLRTRKRSDIYCS